MKVLDSQTNNSYFFYNQKNIKFPISLSSRDLLEINYNFFSNEISIDIVLKKISGESNLIISYLNNNKVIKEETLKIDSNINISKKIIQNLNLSPNKIIISKPKNSIGKIEINRIIISNIFNQKKIENNTLAIISPYRMWGGAEVYLHNMLIKLPKDISLDLCIPNGSKFQNFNYSNNINVKKWINIDNFLKDSEYNQIIFYNSKKIYESILRYKLKNNFIKIYEIYHSDFLWQDSMATKDIDRSNIDKVIKISKSIGNHIDHKDIVVCPPPVDNSIFYSNRRSSEIKNIGYIGRLSAEKKVDIAIEIANKIGLPILVAGDGPLKNVLVQKYNSSAKFLGWQDSVSFYRQIDCLILSSSIEGLPNVILEALSMGLPIVSTDVGGVKEALDGTASILYNDINDYEKIINFIKKEKNFNNKNVEKSFNYNIDTISKFFWNEILLNYKNNIEVFYKNKNSYINGILI